MKKPHFDVIIIGSGFGGSMSARRLIEAGKKVLLIERGEWVERGPHNWESSSSLELTEHYDHRWPYQVKKGGQKPEMGVYASVGGPSVFYGGVSFRFREEDFKANPDITTQSGAKWPINYQDLESYYTEAEQILSISGESGVDPSEPPRSADYPQKPGVLSDISNKIKTAASDIGLRPFQLPLAINYHDKNRNTCTYCTSCDTFACAISAKNDLATVVIPDLLQKGLTLLKNRVAHTIENKNGHVSGVQVYNLISQEQEKYTADTVILSAGALASPQLLASSDLIKYNSAPDLVGRYLMRHVNGIIFGIYPGIADKQKRFHKQLAILDFYLGNNKYPQLGNKIGSLQQLPTPPAALVEAALPAPLGRWIGKAVPLLTGLLAIAEDQPKYNNRIYFDRTIKSPEGLVKTFIQHEYTDRDKSAFKALSKEAKKILSKSGAVTHYVHKIKTFSHAVGTLRMGEDPSQNVLDRNCQYNGVENLYVVDGSFFPTSAALNPSLTISANALRVADAILEK